MTIQTTSAQAQAANADVATQALRLTLLAGYVQSVLGQTFVDRPSGIAARSALIARFDVALGACTAGRDADMYLAIETLRNAALEWLSAVITTLKPVAVVSGPGVMPSLWWAWRLYQDPTRAAELVSRNTVPHPSFMPTTFEALSPT